MTANQVRELLSRYGISIQRGCQLDKELDELEGALRSKDYIQGYKDGLRDATPPYVITQPIIIQHEYPNQYWNNTYYITCGATNRVE